LALAATARLPLCCSWIGAVAELLLLMGWHLLLLPGCPCAVAGLVLLPLLLLPGWCLLLLPGAVAGVVLSPSCHCCQVGTCRCCQIGTVLLPGWRCC
jgi:hypothetical protein